MKNGIDEQVFEIISRRSQRPEIPVSADTRLQDLGIDSLDMVEVLYQLEERFDIQIPDSPDVTERFSEYATAGSVAGVVRTLLETPR
jgi:acyl carrier protein